MPGIVPAAILGASGSSRPDGQDGSLRVPWPALLAEVSKSWRRGQHASVLGQNGSGKSHLMRHLLELWKDARVLLIDTKATDELWRRDFLTVHRFPSWWEQKWQRRGGHREWWRLVPQGSRAERRQTVAHALRAAFKAGDWMVVVDETRSVANRAPDLGLDGDLHELWQRGRSKGVTVLAGAQSPVNLPGGFYDEARRLFVGYIADFRRLKRVAEIAADAEEILDVLREAKEFEFAFVERKFRQPVRLVRAPVRLPGATQLRSQSSDDGHRRDDRPGEPGSAGPGGRGTSLASLLFDRPD